MGFLVPTLDNGETAGLTAASSLAMESTRTVMRCFWRILPLSSLVWGFLGVFSVNRYGTGDGTEGTESCDTMQPDAKAERQRMSCPQLLYHSRHTRGECHPTGLERSTHNFLKSTCD